MSRHLIYVCFASVVLASACSRQKADSAAEPARPAPAKPVSELLGSSATPAAPAEAPPVAPTASEAPAAPAAPATAPDQGTPGVIAPNERQIIEDLQAALQAYYLKNVNSPNHLIGPRSLDELVKSGILKSLPNPPPGKKFVYRPENWQVTIE